MKAEAPSVFSAVILASGVARISSRLVSGVRFLANGPSQRAAQMIRRLPPHDCIK